MDKAQQRKLMKSRLAKLDCETMQLFSCAASERVLDHPAYKSANVILCYAAMQREADPSLIVSNALSEGKRVAYPVCGENFQMQAWEPKNNDALVTGKYGIRTPDIKQSRLVEPKDIELVIVPGLAFDRQGGRLGRGAGYYDRYLASTNAHRLGFCFDAQLVDFIIMESFDLHMHCVVSNSFTINVEKYPAF